MDDRLVRGALPVLRRREHRLHEPEDLEEPVQRVERVEVLDAWRRKLVPVLGRELGDGRRRDRPFEVAVQLDLGQPVVDVWHLGHRSAEVALEDSERVVVIDDDITAHLFAGRGDGAYTSVWLHIRYHESRLLLTGDVHCPYEKRLLWLFSDYDFGSDLLKITHQGSSSGTGVEFLQRVRPGLSIASTATDDGHRLERDTLDRLGGLGSPRRVFETHVDGDIVILTDGRPYGDGILFDVDFEAPGRYAADLGASVLPLSTVD